jgi:hypothetical protein
LVIVRSATGLIVVGSLAVLHGLPAQPPPETLAVLVTDDAAPAATLTVTVMSG